MRISGSWFILLALLVGTGALPLSPLRAGEENSAAGLYEQAIREAERELADEGAGAAPAAGHGWGVTEFLSVAALALAVVLMLWAMRWSRGLFAGGRGGGEMRVLDRRAVGKNNTLLLVRLRDRDYWLAEGPKGVRILAEWPAPKNDAGRNIATLPEHK